MGPLGQNNPMLHGMIEKKETDLFSCKKKVLGTQYLIIQKNNIWGQSKNYVKRGAGNNYF